MKKTCALLITVIVFLVFSGMANASLTTIGTASYEGNDYNLIYEDDSIDGGLVWLDYTNSNDTWQNQLDWVSGLGSNLTVNLFPGYTTDIDWQTGWRLPLTQVWEPGYDQTGSEIGHLYYVSLGNVASIPPVNWWHENSTTSGGLWVPDIISSKSLSKSGSGSSSSPSCPM